MEKIFTQMKLKEMVGLEASITFSNQSFTGTLRTEGTGVYYLERDKNFLCLVENGDKITFYRE
ncbi:MAG: hypothetical protein NUV37_02275 [Nanoarchaeota archaeon]|nr:hypothetical protein [Nanoarchaeota archaeon]